MKDGELLAVGGRYELRFTARACPPGRRRSGTAITTPDGLRAWFPFDVVGERETGAPLRFDFREGEGEDVRRLDGRVLAPSVMELRWEGDETLRLELAESADGCVLTLINRFDEIGKAARDAAGWHTCLDALEASLDGRVARHRLALAVRAPGLRLSLRPRGRHDRPTHLTRRPRLAPAAPAGSTTRPGGPPSPAARGPRRYGEQTAAAASSARRPGGQLGARAARLDPSGPRRCSGCE